MVWIQWVQCKVYEMKPYVIMCRYRDMALQETWMCRECDVRNRVCGYVGSERPGKIDRL